MKRTAKIVEVVPGYCDTQAAAAHIGLTPQMVRRHAHAMNAIFAGRTRLYPVEAVKRFRDAPRKKPGPVPREPRCGG